MTDPGNSTERVRRHRARRRRGLVPVQIVLFEKEVDELIRRQLLPADARADHVAIGKAIGKLLDKALR